MKDEILEQHQRDVERLMEEREEQRQKQERVLKVRDNSRLEIRTKIKGLFHNHTCSILALNYNIKDC